MKYTIILLAYILPFNCFCQDCSFVKENITMRVSNNYFYVIGLYQIKGDSQNVKTLVYPFPIDPLYGDIDSVKILNLSTNELIIPKISNNKKVVFNVDFGKKTEHNIQISYCQKLLGFQAEYILKSTISWKKPLVLANFQLIMPESFIITHFSILPQDSIKTENEVIYYWEKFDFMPKENMSFKFKNK